MKVIRTMVALIAAVTLAGCLPVMTKTPVGTTVGFKNDSVLYGTWKGKNPDDKQQRDGYFHFMLAKDGSLTIAVAMAEGGSDDGWTVFNARAATLGQNHYLNAVMTFDKDEPVQGALKGATFPVLTVVKGKTLTLYLLDEDKAKDAVKAGKIAGTIEPGASGDVVITADAKELDAFMARPEAAKFFKVLLVLKKVE
jgi:hypothetical protein